MHERLQDSKFTTYLNFSFAWQYLYLHVLCLCDAIISESTLKFYPRLICIVLLSAVNN